MESLTFLVEIWEFLTTPLFEFGGSRLSLISVILAVFFFAFAIVWNYVAINEIGQESFN